MITFLLNALAEAVNIVQQNGRRKMKFFIIWLEEILEQRN